jgi:hypothetical protein
MFKSEEEIKAVVRGFESCTTAKTDFHHREHLVVAVWYLQTLSRSDTVAKMRAGLLNFLEHHEIDKQKYSEEVTVFWVAQVESKLEEIGVDVPLVEKCNQVIASFNSTARTPVARVADEESLAKS